MNKLLTAAALAALLASPAFAQQAGPSERPDAITYPMPPQSASDMEAPGSSAYASSGAGVVVVDGVAVGADPDINVRLQLRRDPGANAN
jgi:hypothetical protein